ncbi:hypothetical protein T05_1640 [Trichinella murrelli]|uniref:Uncharacterized protein n=1 Tax=Trichinella murrelli TaxID=144512 RepID=A0A0V0T5P7_9BILA|nr:hypothetical protein T05_15659 [Trichinella murrelli]KRX34843.1 hypothetical protein T05_9363 [Trichinella murrelli]KRX44844.1 hypothetical protein T05_1640 [Trichinella murrelli]
MQPCERMADEVTGKWMAGTENMMDDGLRAGGNTTLKDWERDSRSILQL